MQSESNFRVVLLRFLLYRTGEETTNLTYSVDHGRRPQPEEVLSPRDLNALRERLRMMIGTAIQTFIGGRTWPAGSDPDTFRAEQHSRARPSLETNAEVALSSTLPEKRRIMRAPLSCPQCNFSHPINNPMALKVPSCARR